VYDRIDGEDEDVYYYCTTGDVILVAPKNGHRVLRLKRLFDLDEILEENPYRVGDKVYTFGLDERVRIEKMVAREYGVWYMTTNRKANGYADNFSYEPL
jgi:hypothetical protein